MSSSVGTVVHLRRGRPVLGSDDPAGGVRQREDRRDGADERQDPVHGAHAGLRQASAYPASVTADSTSAGSRGASLVMVTAPVSSTTSTCRTPAISPTSSVTEATQCAQVM